MCSCCLLKGRYLPNRLYLTALQKNTCPHFANCHKKATFARKKRDKGMAKHNDLGKWGEDLVAITADLTTVVFVEVKTRTTDDVSEPADAVNRQKIRNLGIAANNYIKQFNVVEQVRFDVVTIVGNSNENAQLEHIEDAFNPLLA